MVNEFRLRTRYNSIFVMESALAMADWHLKEVKLEFEKNGWRIVAEHPGDGYRVSASWEIARGQDEVGIFIDFDGLDDMKTLPIDQSYGCSIRGWRASGLYFGRKGEGKSVKRERWQKDLKQFVSQLNRL